MSQVRSGRRAFRGGAGVILALALALSASPAAQQERVPAISDLLETYARGEFAAAVRVAAALPDLASWRNAYPTEARAWIDQVPAEVARRQLAAAGLALEVARDRYERDASSWTGLRHIVEWACQELAQEPKPTAGEQAWQRAAVALGQRVKDNGSWLAPGGPVNHLEHAWVRFPHDARLALASIVIGTRGVDTDLQLRIRARDDGRQLTLPSAPVTLGGDSVMGAGIGTPTVRSRNADAGDPREASRSAIAAFDRLLTHPEVGAEGETHVSHLYLMLYDWPAARDHALAATRLASDARVRYLGFVMAGLAEEQLGRVDQARTAYQDALRALPDGQSAALLLAALGDTLETPGQAAGLVRRALATQPPDDDPWRLYYYGDYFRWPTYVAELHEALR